MAPRKKEDFSEMQEVSREKILMAAFELFAKNGYAETSISSIAIKAKISKGLIYHYFRSKEEILKGLFYRMMNEAAAVFKMSEQLPAKQFLEQIIDFSADYIVNQAKMNSLVLRLTIQPEVIKGLKKEIDKVKEKWIGMLIRPFKELKYANPETEAYLLAATFDGMGIGYIAIGNDYPVEAMRELLKKRYKL